MQALCKQNAEIFVTVLQAIKIFFSSVTWSENTGIITSERLISSVPGRDCFHFRQWTSAAATKGSGLSEMHRLVCWEPNEMFQLLMVIPTDFMCVTYNTHTLCINYWLSYLW